MKKRVSIIAIVALALVAIATAATETVRKHVDLSTWPPCPPICFGKGGKC